ncbi:MULTISPECIES: Hachiman antiphage defense system protein HamA [unclassified Anaeromyxobacter]|uniref:Hachiman antiphage defense system protein HamA n=1 Tax=unclassified Anaeromyxobacter TaxID=2620896 RepID=UPI001F584B8A|nr:MULTISPECIES: Hachiman antiphage defense system protein HamA [unclassified Anaeromyxobacter]
MTDDLGLNLTLAAQWFPHEHEDPYVLVRVSDEHAKSWADTLGVAVRRCYVSDSLVIEKALEHNVDKTQIIAARMPDAGATMAGDFGEILVYFYQSAKELPVKAIGPKKWRLKQDRTKPAPHSDVVHFVLPTWPTSSDKDVLLCSEVKTKSTAGESTPIQSAIDDSAKDRTSRLARTLVWLKERALLEPLGDVQIAHLDRFIKATDHPPATKRFRAVAVVCQTLLDEELKSAPITASPEYTVVVIAVPDLKNIYAAVFDSAKKALPLAPHHKSAPPPALEVTAK